MCNGRNKARAIGTVAIALVLIVVSLSGCCLFRAYEDPEVSRKCTPIRSIIAKNYQFSFNVDALVAGGRLEVGISGPELSAEQAARQVELDRVCRAWVAGAIKPPEEWGKFVRQIAAASLAGPASKFDPKEFEKALNETNATLLTLASGKGLITEEESLKTLRDGVAASAKDIKATNQELINTFKALADKAPPLTSQTDIQYVDLSSKIAAMQLSLASINATLTNSPRKSWAPAMSVAERLVGVEKALTEVQQTLKGGTLCAEIAVVGDNNKEATTDGKVLPEKRLSAIEKALVNVQNELSGLRVRPVLPGATRDEEVDGKNLSERVSALEADLAGIQQKISKLQYPVGSVTDRSDTSTDIRLPENRLANVESTIVSVREELRRLRIALATSAAFKTPINETDIQESSRHILTYDEAARVPFRAGSADLTESARVNLRKKLEKYRNKIVHFEVTGYTDKSGNAKANGELSLNRALAIRDWIMDELRVPAFRVFAIGHFTSIDRYPRREDNRVGIVKVAH